MSIKTKIKNLRMKWLPSKEEKMQEKEAFDRIKNFYGQFVSVGDLCFDVGSNVGNRVSPLLGLGAKVVAIEPQEKCYTYLKEKFGNRIILITKGIGSEEGVKNFHISNATTISSFSEEWINAVKEDRFKEFTWNKTEEIEMTTLDVLIRQYGIPVFIKIDVEGYELEVLKGLTSPAKMISFEYTVPEQTSRVLDCIHQLKRVSSNYVFNYSIGESMKFELEEFIGFDEMQTLISTEGFNDSNFGDVYAMLK